MLRSNTFQPQVYHGKFMAQDFLHKKIPRLAAVSLYLTMVFYLGYLAKYKKPHLPWKNGQS